MAIPTIILDLIKKRPDLLELGFSNEINERRLVRWLLKDGFREYPDLLKNKEANELFFLWLGGKSTQRGYKSISKIALGIWDISRNLRRRWPAPGKNSFYEIWVKLEWRNFNLKLPEYELIFKNKPVFSDEIFKLIFDFLWYLRKPISLKLNNYFKTDLDYYFSMKLDGWRIQYYVVSGLLYRELKTRVSQVRFGVLGVFIEPLGVIALFLLIFSLLRRGSSMDPLLFLISGIVLYTLFSNIAIRSSNGVSANEALFFYRPVKPVDTVIARTLVESGLYSIIFVSLISFTFVLREEIILQDLPLLVITLLGLIIFSFGLGIFLMVATFVYPVIIQIIPFILRPLWFISGVVVSINSLPQYIRPYVSWNPILQAIELTRYSFTKNYILDTSVISLVYLWQCALGALFLGLFVYFYNEKKMLTK